MTSTVSQQTHKERAVFVLGASGQLGQMTMRCWPHDASILGSSRSGKGDFLKLDLMVKPNEAVRILRGKGAIICMAGITPAAVTHRGDVYSRNTNIGCAAISAAHHAGAGRVFLTSSAAVYSGTTGDLDEAAQLNPLSDYGRAKAEMEVEALALAAELNHPVTILRIGNVAGADAILGGWRSGMQLDQLPDGSTPKRSYIGPHTLAQTLHALTKVADLPPVLNLSAPGAVEMGTLLDAAERAWTPRKAPDTVIADVTLSTKLLETYVDFAPQSSTPRGLVAEWRAYQNR